MTYVLFNPKATRAMSAEHAKIVANAGSDAQYISVLDINDMKAFIEGLDASDNIMLMGGDGTLRHFAADLAQTDVRNQIDFIPAGSGNDFYADVSTMSSLAGVDNKADLFDGRVHLNRYIKNLPRVRYGEVEKYFINGTGCGIDGEACYVGMKQHQRTGKPANYSLIALELALFGYRKNHAVITVDGKAAEFDDVWMVTTMRGRFFGGGVMIAPAQNRLNEEGTLSVVCLHKKNRLVTVSRFGTLFKGEHVKYRDWCYIAQGRDIHVDFTIPCTLQIDGDIVPEVSSYSVKA